MEDIEGTNIERRIGEVIAMGANASRVYQTKASTGTFNTHAHRYTKEQMDLMTHEMADLLYFFGYSNFEEESPTNFFQFDEHTEEHKSLHK